MTVYRSLPRFGVGKPVKRLKDPRLLTGRGLFTDDLFVDGAALRSLHAYASIRSIDVADASAIDGVLGIYTSKDIASLGTIQCMAPLQQDDGTSLFEQCVYDGAGQLLSGSFMDYCVPRAYNLTDFPIELVEDYPCKMNMLGIKGAGEAGAVAAPPVIINAISSTLSHPRVPPVSTCLRGRSVSGAPCRRLNES